MRFRPIISPCLFGFTLFLFLGTSFTHASIPASALEARQKAMEALQHLKPETLLKDYTENPNEAGLKPEEGQDKLNTDAYSALSKNQEAKSLYNNAISRPRVRINPKSDELLYAEKLLEHPDEVLSGTCYQMPAECTQEVSTKSCEEDMAYTMSSCLEKKEISLISSTHRDVRAFGIGHLPRITFDLSHCRQGERGMCRDENLFKKSGQCEALSLKISNGKQTFLVSKPPTCDDTLVTFELSGYVSPYTNFVVEVSEQRSVEHIAYEGCSKSMSDKGACFISSEEACLEPNATKVIDGVKITRPCWGRAIHYQCGQLKESHCLQYLNEGCTQVNSACVLSNDNKAPSNLCTRYTQTFSCKVKHCVPQKTVCDKKMDCVDGSCDESSPDVSNDMAEGVSRLGALIGASDAVKMNGSAHPLIFGGEAISCKKYPLGIRDCCKDSGWGDWALHCPPELKTLLKAKQEGRAFYVGRFKPSKLGNHHYTYCVFPSKLSSIFQIEGRLGQKGIGFGTPEYPKCEGLTPELLETINFSLLNLSPIEREMMDKFKAQDPGQMTSTLSDEINALYTKGAPHDASF